MRMLRTALALLLSACSPVDILNAMAPRDGVSIVPDLAYDEGSRHTLDVYAPRRAEQPAPVVLFFYGGNWDSGSKEMYRFVGAALAARGVVTVIPDYRLYPQVRFPAFMHDAAGAFDWTKTNAARFGGNPHRVFLMGHSAGAQIATLLALDPRYLRPFGQSHHDICGVIGLAGPYDFLPLHSAELLDIFGPEAEQQRSQPINYVTPQAPPMLLIAGRDDTTVDPHNTTRLVARLRAEGVTVEADLYPGIGHRLLLGSVARPLAFVAPVREAVIRFVTANCTSGV
jgi:acetyl esterase/lipase